MSFIEGVYEEQLERTLKDVITYVNQHLTRSERARLLLLLAKEMAVAPRNLVKVSVDWRGKAE